MRFDTSLPWGPNAEKIPGFLHNRDGYDLSSKALVKKGSSKSKKASAQKFLSITNSWDKGTSSFRLELLHDFVEQNKGKTCPELENELCNGAALFLTRISAWLRLTYLSSSNLNIQLEAINVFLAAAGGQQFLVEFVESGGLLTALEILGLPKASDSEKTVALQSIYYIAAAGRQFKEFICESYGIRSICECLSRSSCEVTLERCKLLLIQLSTGNAKFVSQTYKSLVSVLVSPGATTYSQIAAAQTLRQVLSLQSSVSNGIVDVVLDLLCTLNLQLQYEAYQLLLQLYQRPDQQSYLVRQVVATITNPIEFDASTLPTDDVLQASKSKIPISDQTLLDQVAKKMPHVVAMYIQQAYCAKFIGVAVASSDEGAVNFIDQQVVAGLLKVISNVEHREGQKFATSALRYLMERFDCVATALRSCVGEKFVERVEMRPDTFYRELTRKQIEYLKHNKVLVIRRTQESETEDILHLETSQTDLANAMKSRYQNYELEASLLQSAFPDDGEDRKPGVTQQAGQTAQHASSAEDNLATGNAVLTKTESLAQRTAMPNSQEARAPEIDSEKMTQVPSDNSHPEPFFKAPDDPQRLAQLRANMDVPEPKLYQPMSTLNSNRTFVGNALISKESNTTADAVFEKSLSSFLQQQSSTRSGHGQSSGNAADRNPLFNASETKIMSQSLAPNLFKAPVHVPELAKKSDKDVVDDYFQR